MLDFQKILKKDNYKKLRFKISKTQHLLLKAKINGIEGKFILDTGASSSCVGTESIEKFKLKAQNCSTKASGAGATGIKTQIAKNNLLQLGSWKMKKYPVIIFDLSHVNEALLQHNAKPVDGIIGADVLLSGKAIIDYASKLLFLKG